MEEGDGDLGVDNVKRENCMLCGGRVKRVGFELQITREMNLVRGGGGARRAGGVSRRQGRRCGEVASAGER